MTFQERILRLERYVKDLSKKICCINNTPSIGSFLIPIVSLDFEVNGTTYVDSNLNGVTYELFFNDLNRFLYNEPGNQEWDYIPGGGFDILLPGFDANSNDYHIYLIPKS